MSPVWPGSVKDTVYLHFRTKEALFVTALLREQRAVLGGMTARMRADPAEALPSAMRGPAMTTETTTTEGLPDAMAPELIADLYRGYGRLREQAALVRGTFMGQLPARTTARARRWLVRRSRWHCARSSAGFRSLRIATEPTWRPVPGSRQLAELSVLLRP